jgi:hypothetical protein
MHLVLSKSDVNYIMYRKVDMVLIEKQSNKAPFISCVSSHSTNIFGYKRLYSILFFVKGVKGSC